MQAIDLTSSDAAESGATTTTADESDISNSKKKALVLPSFFTFARKDRNQWAHCNDCVKVHGQDSEAGKAFSGFYGKDYPAGVTHAKRFHSKEPAWMTAVADFDKARQQKEAASTPAAKRAKTQMAISKFVRAKSTATLDEAEVALQNFIVACNLPFALVEAPAFKEFVSTLVVYGASQRPNGLDLGGRKKLADLLYSKDNGVIRIANKEVLNQYKSVAMTRGITLSLDGATFHRESLQVITLNLAAGAMFYDVDKPGLQITGSDYYERLCSSIIDGSRKITSTRLDPSELALNTIAQSVVAVTTDNARAPLSGILRLSKIGIIAFGDRAHALQRTMTHFGQKLPFLKSVLCDAARVISVFRDLKFARELLKAVQGDKPLQLFRFVETRFLYHVVALSRLLRLKPSLVDAINRQGMYDEGLAALGPGKRRQAREVKDLIKLDEFWAKLDASVSLLAPFIKAVRLMDLGTANISMVYPMMVALCNVLKSEMRRLVGKVSTKGVALGLDSTCLDAMSKVFDDDYARYNAPIFGAAFAVDPVFRHDLLRIKSADPDEFDAVFGDLMTTMKTHLIRYSLADAPLPSPRLVDDDMFMKDVRDAQSGFSEYLSGTGKFSTYNPANFASAADLYSTATGLFAKVALRLISIVPGSINTERQSGKRDRIHSLTRAKMDTRTVSDLQRTQEHYFRAREVAEVPTDLEKISGLKSIANIESYLKDSGASSEINLVAYVQGLSGVTPASLDSESLVPTADWELSEKLLAEEGPGEPEILPEPVEEDELAKDDSEAPVDNDDIVEDGPEERPRRARRLPASLRGGLWEM